MIQPVRFITNHNPREMHDVLQVLKRILESQLVQLSQQVWKTDLVNEMLQEKAKNLMTLDYLKYSCEAIEQLYPVGLYGCVLQQLNSRTNVKALLASGVVEGQNGNNLEQKNSPLHKFGRNLELAELLEQLDHFSIDLCGYKVFLLHTRFHDEYIVKNGFKDKVYIPGIATPNKLGNNEKAVQEKRFIVNSQLALHPSKDLIVDVRGN